MRLLATRQPQAVPVQPVVPTVSLTVAVCEVVPLVPVMVTVAVAAAALDEAAKVTLLLVPVVEAGLNVAVTPVGSPLAVSATDPVKFVRVMVTVLTTLEPALTESVAGLAAMAKSCVVVPTVRAIDAVRLSVPPAQVTVTVAGPAVAVAEAARVRTVLLPVTEAGAKVAVTPAGSPLALQVSAAVKLVRVTAMVLVPLAPRFTESVAGLAAMAKSCVVVPTVRAIDAVRPRVPPAQVTVTVAGPVVAVAEAASVRTVLLPVTEAGAKVAVTPAGSPLALQVSAVVKLVRVTAMVLVPLAPRFTESVAGLAAMAKSCVVVPPGAVPQTSVPLTKAVMLGESVRLALPA